MICSGGVVQLVFLAVFFCVGVTSLDCVLRGIGGVALWGGPVLWTKLIRVPFQGECTAVVAAWVSAWSAANSWGVRYPNEECGRMLL